ncbi:MAG: hypothetical protein WD294_14960 [Phycisphaeraceae bacterium]
MSEHLLNWRGPYAPRECQGKELLRRQWAMLQEHRRRELERQQFQWKAVQQ